MVASRKITVQVPEDMALAIDAKVTSGAYADRDEFVVEGLATYMMGQDSEVETWLRDEVGPTCDRFMSENTPGIPSGDVFAGIKDRYLARKRRD